VVTDPLEEATTMEFPHCPRATHAELAQRFDRWITPRRTRRIRRPARPRERHGA
jgi:hypothetical protein